MRKAWPIDFRLRACALAPRRGEGKGGTPTDPGSKAPAALLLLIIIIMMMMMIIIVIVIIKIEIKKLIIT